MSDTSDTAGSIRWLLDRLPPGTPGPTWSAVVRGVPTLQWSGAGGTVYLDFRDGHTVGWDAWGREVRENDGPRCGTLNLAMNLTEIIDLILWAKDGKERWRHQDETEATATVATTCPR